MRAFRNESPVQNSHLVQRRYDFYGDDTEKRDRVTSGTVVRAFSNQVYLDSAASSTNDTYNNYGITIDSGTGSGQDHLRVNDYTVQSVTNLLTRSEEFDHADWVKGGTTSVTGTNVINFPVAGDDLLQNTTLDTANKTVTLQWKLSGAGSVTLQFSNGVDDFPTETSFTLSST